MGLVSNILLTDIAHNAAPREAGRVAYDPKVIRDHEFLVKHGMTRAQYAERDSQWRRRDFEERTVADLDSDLEAIAGTSDSARHKLTMFGLIRDRERTALKNLETRRDRFQEFVNAPAKTQSKISEAIARTKAWLLGGTTEEPVIDRAALDAELALASHKAQAAEAAIAELDKQIEVAGIRVNRLADAERGFLNDAVAEVASGMLETLSRKRAELAGLERLCEPLRKFGIATHGKPESVEIKWRHSWPDVAAALKADPSGDVSKLLPRVPG
jgi:hypothetical protein